MCDSSDLTFVDCTKEDGKRVSKSIPCTMSVQRVKILANKLLRIRGVNTYIKYRSAKVSPSHCSPHCGVSTVGELIV